MLSIAATRIGSLELAIMECFWTSGPQTSGQILVTLRRTRTIAHPTVTTTLTRLLEQGLVTRAPVAGRKLPWVYTARYASRSALLAGAFEQFVAEVHANPLDRAEALGMLLGLAR